MFSFTSITSTTTSSSTSSGGSAVSEKASDLDYIEVGFASALCSYQNQADDYSALHRRGLPCDGRDT